MDQAIYSEPAQHKQFSKASPSGLTVIILLFRSFLQHLIPGALKSRNQYPDMEFVDSCILYS